MPDLPRFGVVDEHVRFVYARVLDLLRLRFGDLLSLVNEHRPRLRENFARQRVCDRLGAHDVVRRDAAGQTIGEIEFFVVLITPHFRDVVAAGIEEQIIEVLADGILRGDFAGAQTAVQFDEAVHLRTGGILFQRLGNNAVAGKEVLYGAVGAETERAQKDGDAQLFLSVHADVQGAFRVLFEFQPRAAVGHDGGVEHLLARLVLGGRVVHAGRTDELGDNDALRAVDDERAVLRHEGQIPHEHFLIEHLVLHLVDETDLDPEGQGVSGVAVAALLFVVLGLVAEAVVEKIQFEVVGVIGDRGEVLEYLADAFLNERVVAVLLDLDEIGNVDDLVDGAEFPAFVLSVL